MAVGFAALARPPGVFLLLTFAIVLVIVLFSRSVPDAASLLAVLTGFLFIAMQLVALHDKYGLGSERPLVVVDAPVTAPPAPPADTFADADDLAPGPAEDLLPGAPAGGSLRMPPPRPYPGAIEDGGVDDPELAPYGHDTWPAGGRRRAAADGNPYDLDRARSAQARPSDPMSAAGVVGVLDADELGALHGRARNEATRVAAGTAGRKRMMDFYLREELDEEEDANWWGRHEV